LKAKHEDTPVFTMVVHASSHEFVTQSIKNALKIIGTENIKQVHKKNVNQTRFSKIPNKIVKRKKQSMD